MSRFVNLGATERWTGPCECDGTPHDEDWVEFRAQPGYEDLTVIADLSTRDPTGLPAAVLRRAVRAWNLADESGETAPVSPDAIASLDPITADAIYRAIDVAWVKAVSLPNRSGARSQASSRASASRPPKTPRHTTS